MWYSLYFSRGHCQRSLPLQIFDMSKFVRTKCINTEQCPSELSPRVIPPVYPFLPKMSLLLMLLCYPHQVWTVPFCPEPLGDIGLPQPPHLCWEDNFQFYNLSGWIKKNECWGGLKEFIPHILAWRRGGRGLYLVSCAYIYYRMSLTKHWNNLFCLAHDNNNKEFYWVYFSYCKHVSVFFEDLEFNTIFFHWIQWICFCCQSDSKWSQVQFYTWFQYCTSTCSRFAIGKATTPLKYVRKFSAKCIYIKRKKRLNLLTDLFSL